MQPEISGTFSIAAVNPETGECGAAVASKYPAVGQAVAHVRPGVGAFCTQHYHVPEWGAQALDMLEAGTRPEEVLARLLGEDTTPGKRQLAIINIRGECANRNPDTADPDGDWWGAMAGKYYACQGNTLTGMDVITAMAQAYEESTGSLGDRLMAALLAGDEAGGDHRGRLAAGIKVAGPDGKMQVFDVDESDDAVNELNSLYMETRTCP